jgi:hypothetical protein
MRGVTFALLAFLLQYIKMNHDSLPESASKPIGHASFWLFVTAALCAIAGV